VRPGKRWRDAGAACGAQRGGAEQLKLGTWPAKRRQASGRAKVGRSRAGGRKVDEGTDSQFFKNTGTLL
jgi:hypothetical protein